MHLSRFPGNQTSQYASDKEGDLKSITGANLKLFFPPTNSENCWRFPGLRQSGRVAPSHWPIRGIGVYNQSQLRSGLFLSQKPDSREFSCYLCTQYVVQIRLLTKASGIFSSNYEGPLHWHIPFDIYHISIICNANKSIWLVCRHSCCILNVFGQCIFKNRRKFAFCKSLLEQT